MGVSEKTASPCVGQMAVFLCVCLPLTELRTGAKGPLKAREKERKISPWTGWGVGRGRRRSGHRNSRGAVSAIVSP